MKAAKEKTFLLLVVALACVFASPALASSTRVLAPENRAELFLPDAQNRIEQQAFESAKHVENYDSSWEVAPESSVAPNRVDDVIAETLAGRQTPGQRNITSRHTLDENEALGAGMKFLGPGHKEIGKPGSGVFRSADGRRQFRMDESSLMGDHAPHVPHVHLETFQGGRKPFLNNHIPIRRGR